MGGRSFCKITIEDDSPFFVFTDIPHSLLQLKESVLEYFNVSLCNGTDVYCGKVHLSDISEMALGVEMEEEKYYTTLRKCLCKGDECKSMKFTYHLVEDGGSSYKFIWKQELDDEMKFQLGSMHLRKEDCPSIKTMEIFSYFSQHLKTLTSEVGYLTRTNTNLEAEKKAMSKRLEKYVDAKDKLEQELFTKFALVLNEKKARIRELKGKLDSGETEDRSKDSDDSIAQGEDHGDTDTDEEVEREKKTKQSMEEHDDLGLMFDETPSRLEDSPKKSKKRIRKGKPKESGDSILLPRGVAPSKPDKPSSDDVHSSTSETDAPMPPKKLRPVEITEEDLLDQLMF